MNILVIGSGGREHALAWSLARSPQVQSVLVSPGNGGTEASGHQGKAGARVSNVADLKSDPDGVVALAKERDVALVVVGPEAPLAAGMADELAQAGLPCFGPVAAAARLESSKAYAKAFMARHQIPSARFAVFDADQLEQALAYVEQVDYRVVIKVSGLAAGKGVLLPKDTGQAQWAIRRVLAERAFGRAGDLVVIEERLRGQEVSVLAFCDGKSLQVMPPAQDHKRIFDGDKGPNTGGMGAYAPAPVVTPELQEEVLQRVLRPAVQGLAAEGNPFVGVLYAGLMITDQGPQVLEFNCRFGDPEAQALLPLLRSDPVEVMLACVQERLHEMEIEWHGGAAATVVAAARGYPGTYEKGMEIHGVTEVEAGTDGGEEAGSGPGTDVVVFHAGTRREPDGRLLVAGGRVLAVTGLGSDLAQALERAYTALGRIHFEGMHFRRDIGARALGPQAGGPGSPPEQPR